VQRFASQDLAGGGRQQKKLVMLLILLVVLLVGSLYDLYPMERPNYLGGVL
jgi:hypothetical protein